LEEKVFVFAAAVRFHLLACYQTGVMTAAVVSCCGDDAAFLREMGAAPGSL